MDDVHALKPTVFCGVPRVYDKLYAGNRFDQFKNLVLFFFFNKNLKKLFCEFRCNAKNLSWWFDTQETVRFGL